MWAIAYLGAELQGYLSFLRLQHLVMHCRRYGSETYLSVGRQLEKPPRVEQQYLYIFALVSGLQAQQRRIFWDCCIVLKQAKQDKLIKSFPAVKGNDNNHS